MNEAVLWVNGELEQLLSEERMIHSTVEDVYDVDGEKSRGFV